MRIIKLVILLTFISCYSAFSQVKNIDFTTEEYLQDYDFIVELIKNQHPNPFRFISEEQFEKEAHVLREGLKKEPTLANFLLSNPLTLIRDTHSDLNVDDLVFDAFVKQINFFPLETIVYDQRVFVNQFAREIPLGAEIITVNTKKVTDILAKIPAKVDGDIQGSTQKKFSLYASLLFPKAEVFTIQYKESVKGSLKSVQLKAVNYTKYDYNSNKTVLPFDLLSYRLGISGYLVNKDTYLISIRSFDLSEAYAYSILNNLFTSIKDQKVKHIIVDIRDNQGGSLSNIPLFYSFISTEKSFSNIYKYATKVPKINVKANLLDENGKLANANDILSQDNFMQQRFDKNEEDGFYYGNNRLDEYYVENYPQDKNAFTGDVALLINNNTVSAASYFASLFQLNARGALVGQETRSCSGFTTAAWFVNYKLPYTESIVSLPRSEIFFNIAANKDKNCRGVLPQYTVTADEFQKGLQNVQDAEMDLALRLLKK